MDSLTIAAGPHWNLLRFCLAAEGQYLFHKIFCPMACLDHLIQVTRYYGARQAVFIGHFRIAEDCPEDIVEVMGNAPGQGADGFHLLGLLEVGLQRFSSLLPPAYVR